VYLILIKEAVLKVGEATVSDFREALAEVLKRIRRSCATKGRNCKLSTSFWSMFTTYYYLRRKGKKVLPEGRREGTIIEIRKNKWWAEYLVLEEGVKIALSGLVEWVEETRANDLKAVIAVVDRNGSVTFYEAAKVNIKGADSRKELDSKSATSS